MRISKKYRALFFLPVFIFFNASLARAAKDNCIKLISLLNPDQTSPEQVSRANRLLAIYDRFHFSEQIPREKQARLADLQEDFRKMELTVNVFLLVHFYGLGNDQEKMATIFPQTLEKFIDLQREILGLAGYETEKILLPKRGTLPERWGLKINSAPKGALIAGIQGAEAKLFERSLGKEGKQAIFQYDPLGNFVKGSAGSVNPDVSQEISLLTVSRLTDRLEINPYILEEYRHSREVGIPVFSGSKKSIPKDSFIHFDQGLEHWLREYPAGSFALLELSAKDRALSQMEAVIRDYSTIKEILGEDKLSARQLSAFQRAKDEIFVARDAFARAASDFALVYRFSKKADPEIARWGIDPSTGFTFAVRTLYDPKTRKRIGEMQIPIRVTNVAPENKEQVFAAVEAGLQKYINYLETKGRVTERKIAAVVGPVYSGIAWLRRELRSGNVETVWKSNQTMFQKRGISLEELKACQ